MSLAEEVEGVPRFVCVEGGCMCMCVCCVGVPFHITVTLLLCVLSLLCLNVIIPMNAFFYCSLCFGNTVSKQSC